MKRFRSILLVVDANESCQIVLERAVALAENHQAELSVLHLAPQLFLPSLSPVPHSALRAPHLAPQILLPGYLPEDPPFGMDLQSRLIVEQAERLDEVVAPWRKRIPISTKVQVGTPFLEIVREVLRSGHDLVIRTAEPQGWLGRVVGRDDMHLLRKCPCPVWLMRCQTRKACGRILAAVDLGDVRVEAARALNRDIVELAGSLALSELAELHVIGVWDAVGEGTRRGGLVSGSRETASVSLELARQQQAARLAELRRDMASLLGGEAMDYLKPQTYLVKGLARSEIPALAKGMSADLIVMGATSRSGMKGLVMGNTAELVLERIACSVLAIKPPGFVTPVVLDDEPNRRAVGTLRRAHSALQRAEARPPSGSLY